MPTIDILKVCSLMMKALFVNRSITALNKGYLSKSGYKDSS
jgi:hypothetical protein